MLDRIVSHAELLSRIDELGRERRLIGPVARSVPECEPPVRYFYEPVQRAAQLSLDFPYSVYGPKAFVLPPRETLFEFDRNSRGFRARATFDVRPTALIGVHPCDLHALLLLDAVFAQDHPDEHYLARRRHLLIIGVDCLRPCSGGVFCGDLGTNEPSRGFDAQLYPLPGADPERSEEGEFSVKFGTDAGRVWLRTAGRAARPSDEDRFAACQHAKHAAFAPTLRTATEQLPNLVSRSYGSLLWEATAERCYSCGSCNLVCPTCYCFDVRDDADLVSTTGRREREWDACMLRDFTTVAGGHNFRSKAAHRLRHRLLRKMAWIRDRTGLAGCVGCARCDRACTAKISMVEMLNQLSEEAADVH